MVDQLFGSKTRVKLLKFFFSNQEEEFYVRELTRLLDEQINSIRRELINLADAGVVKSVDKDNKVFYCLNKKGELYEGLNKILGTEEGQEDKTSKSSATSTTKESGEDGSKKGIVVKDAKLKLIKERLGSLSGIKYIAVSGVLLKNSAKGVDLLVVGDFYDPKLINEAIQDIETRLNKGLSYVIMNEADYRYRTKINDRFLMAFTQNKNEVLLDELS